MSLQLSDSGDLRRSRPADFMVPHVTTLRLGPPDVKDDRHVEDGLAAVRPREALEALEPVGKQQANFKGVGVVRAPANPVRTPCNSSAATVVVFRTPMAARIASTGSEIVALALSSSPVALGMCLWMRGHPVG